jgi:hypothetical protein
MRTINTVKTEEEETFTSPTPIKSAFFDEEERYPCWYADLETGVDRKDYVWKVGRKHLGQIDEYSFKVKEAGDVHDDDVWNRLVGVDFAVELIRRFKDGGSKATKKWVKKGCP